MRLSPIRLVTGALAVGALSLALGGPAFGAKVTAKQAVANAIKATETASSVQFNGTVVQGTQTVTLAVAASNSGVGQGTIGIGSGVATVRSVGGTIYFMGTSQFWSQQGGQSAAQLFAGKWVSTAASSKSGQSLGLFLNSTSFLKSLFGPNLKSSNFAFAGKSQINGQSTTVISGRDKNGKNSGKIYVSSSGSQYILRITFAGKTTGMLNFSKYNAPVTPVVPSGAIDLDTLSGSSSSG